MMSQRADFQSLEVNGEREEGARRAVVWLRFWFDILLVWSWFLGLPVHQNRK